MPLDGKPSGRATKGGYLPCRVPGTDLLSSPCSSGAVFPSPHSAQPEVLKVQFELQARVPVPWPRVAQVCPFRSVPSQSSPESTTPLPQREQPEVSKVQEEVQARVPEPKPWVTQVCPSRSVPSHCSVDWLTVPSPQNGQFSCDGGSKSSECLVTVFEPWGPLIRVTLTTFRIFSAPV